MPRAMGRAVGSPSTDVAPGDVQADVRITTASIRVRALNVVSLLSEVLSLATRSAGRIVSEADTSAVAPVSLPGFTY